MGNQNGSETPQKVLYHKNKQTENSLAFEELETQNQIDEEFISEQKVKINKFLSQSFNIKPKASKVFSSNNEVKNKKSNIRQETSKNKRNSDFEEIDVPKKQKQQQHNQIRNYIYEKQNFSENSLLSTPPQHMINSLQIQNHPGTSNHFSNTKSRNSHDSYLKNCKSIKIKHSSFVKIRKTQFTFFYEFLQKIGQGSFGTVFKAKCKKTQEIRAVKILKKKIVDSNSFLQQLDILRKLDHPNIIKIYDIFFINQIYYVVTEHCAGGSLHDFFIKSDKTIDVNIIKTIMKQLLSSLCYLHSQMIIHRDIKLENIMFENDPFQEPISEIQIKLIDFGLAKKVKFRGLTKDKPYIGSPKYLAPEVLQGKYYQKSDIWSCGILLHQLLTGMDPYHANTLQQLYQAIQHQKIKFQSKFHLNLVMYSQKVKENIKQLLNRMLERNPIKRISANEALGYKWFEAQTSNIRTTEKLKTFTKLKTYKKTNNFRRFIQSYLVHLKQTDNQRKKFIEIFKELDTNNNGVLQIHQLKTLLPQGLSQKQTTVQLAQILEKLDKNNSGKIQFSEFIAAVENRQKLFTYEHLQQAFEYLDTNKNGYIDKKQLKKAISGCGQEEYQYLFQDIDQDLDEQISKDEFITYLIRNDQKFQY